MVQAVTARIGPPYIATRAEAVLGAYAVLELFAEHAHDADAAIVGAFADPGLGAARELLPIPVVGMAEAAMLTACMLGLRFAIVTFAQAMEPWYQECVDYHGLAGRCAGVFCLDEPFADIAGVAEEKAAKLVALCGQAVRSGADVCILGGAPLAGLAQAVADQVPVPLVDGVAGGGAPGGDPGGAAPAQGERGQLPPASAEAGDRGFAGADAVVRRPLTRNKSGSPAVTGRISDFSLRSGPFLKRNVAAYRAFRFRNVSLHRAWAAIADFVTKPALSCEAHTP